MITSWVEYCKRFFALKMSNELGEKTKQLGGNDSDFMINVEKAIRETKLFSIDEDTLKLLILTKCPDKNKHIKLPFETMFVNAVITKEELGELGVDVENDLNGFIIQEGTLRTSFSSDINAGRTIRAITCMKERGKYDDYTQFVTFNMQYEVNEEYKDCQITILNKLPKMKKFLNNLTLNLINLINDPEITIIEQEEDISQNQKRIKKGKIPIPKNLVVKITGERKRYINKMISSGERSFGYRFWVRGFWRVLSAKRYGKNQGKRIWIMPHIRGKGLLVEKEYHVEKKNGIV